MLSIFGVSGFRAARHTHKLRSSGAGFGVSDSIKNQGVCDTHNFLWKIFEIGGVF